MNNNAYIITILQNFEKPEQGFIKDKECLICLEPFDLELNQYVMLPCKCANSVYHIGCILLLLNSGQNKNFCPHCKTNYNILMQNQILPNLTQMQQQQNLQVTNFTHILVIHILSNSIMNIVNIVVARNAFKTNLDEALQLLLLLYFTKLFLNYCILMYSKSHIDKIEDCLVFSYFYQMILFGLLIYALTKIKTDINFIVLIVNNVLLGFGDLTFRIIIEYRMTNVVSVIE
jgi:hypothetical protein